MIPLIRTVDQSLKNNFGSTRTQNEFEITIREND